MVQLHAKRSLSLLCDSWFGIAEGRSERRQFDVTLKTIRNAESVNHSECSGAGGGDEEHLERPSTS